MIAQTISDGPAPIAVRGGDVQTLAGNIAHNSVSGFEVKCPVRINPRVFG